MLIRCRSQARRNTETKTIASRFYCMFQTEEGCGVQGAHHPCVPPWLPRELRRQKGCGHGVGENGTRKNPHPICPAGMAIIVYSFLCLCEGASISKFSAIFDPLPPFIMFSDGRLNFNLFSKILVLVPHIFVKLPPKVTHRVLISIGEG